MNSKEVFEALDKALNGNLKAYDAAEVYAGREPAHVQIHDAIAAVVASCFFRAPTGHHLCEFLRHAEEAISKARSAAQIQYFSELEQIEAGNVAGIHSFTR